MLRKTFVYSSIFLALFVGLFITNLLITTKKDLLEYQKIQNRSSGIDSKTVYQKRTNVKKDLYIVDNFTRKHYSIKSDLSTIFINRKNDRYILKENLDKITLICFENSMDNKLEHIKHITAQSGVYFFPTHKFELSDVNLSFVNTMKGLDIEPYFKGKANKLLLSIHEKKPKIEALNFIGSFDPKKESKCEK
ncbi:MAG: hypothetical protein K940chlam1_00804 [Candidatus Anoxychlamydiales bacterium]|nr:hypothetical protein [Candidatus Anoxychlamydiales bacterium]NGX36572.1 hypothetical protein [Candidatus Anoxychlamydiales bacterium]